MPSDDVDAIVELVAEHPGRTADDLADVVNEEEIAPDRTQELLETALERDLILETDSKYWVIRKRKYAYDKYDHPEP
ncbi:hypothetical protein GWK26_12735 [haloarchaeon 3A1-DGR]|nr:hypothetical protein GWK26_12735 [haloarchaeon 3A1-DGR]